MMGKTQNYWKFPFLVLLYGLIAIMTNINYGSVFHDEAINIFMGRQVLQGQYCPLCPQNTGAVFIHPVLAAIGDAIGGIYGARAVGMIFGLGLSVVIYMTGRTLFSEKFGLLSTTIFLFIGTSIYLSKLATYDIVAAFFLGLSFFLIVASEKNLSSSRSGLFLFLGALALLLASITKYTVAVFILPLLIYVFLKHKLSRGMLYFLLPLLILILLYAYFAFIPAWAYLKGSTTGVYKEGFLPFMVISSRIFRWLGIPYILAIFGMFHREKGFTAVTLALLSTPVVLLHIVTGDGRSVDKNVIFSIVFLAPAMALGVEHIGSLFSTNISSSWVKPFFITAVLVILWTYGLYDLRWLEKQYPDISPVINFLNHNGFENMTLVIDSQYGDPDYIYRYSLEKKYPNAQFLSMSHISQKEQDELLIREKPDFLIVDEYYSTAMLRERAMKYVQKDYLLAGDLNLSLSWGVQNVKIFRRR